VTAIGLPRLRLPTWARPGGAAKEASGELTAAASVAQWMLLSIAGLALWFAAFGVGLSALQEQHAQHSLYATFRAQLSAGTAPLGGAISEGSPVAMLQSQAADLNSIVVAEGTTSSDLQTGPGHYPGTVLPGQPGISVLFGRSVSYGGPFRSIASMQAGDKIVATTGQGRFTYVVEDVRRAGDPIPTTLATGSHLLLVTSEATGWRAGWAPSRAVYVDATLTGKAVPAVASVAGLKSADQPMHGDTSQLFALVLWMQLLLVGVVGVVIARVRWGTWQPWLIGVPVVLAALWGATSSVWVLLPNLI
jgi:sortase A